MIELLDLICVWSTLAFAAIAWAMSLTQVKNFGAKTSSIIVRSGRSAPPRRLRATSLPMAIR